MATGVKVNSDGKVSVTADGKIVIGSAGSCCCSGCYQRWTVRWNCGDPGFFDDVVAAEKKCFGSGDVPPTTTWEKYATTDTYCDYEIWVDMGSGCSVDADCAALDDTTAPDPYGCVDIDCTGPYIVLGADNTTPLDCCCPCQCCQPVPITLIVGMDASGLSPTAPAGGYITIAPVAPNDWHDGPWIPVPDEVFLGTGGTMPYQSSGTYLNCDVVVATKPQPAYPFSDPTNPPFVPDPTMTLFNYTGGNCTPDGFGFSITLSCTGTSYEVDVAGYGWNDMCQTNGPLGGFLNPTFVYSGTVTDVSLACVNGRPTGTVTVEMTWASDIYTGISPGSWDCGSIVVTFS